MDNLILENEPLLRSSFFLTVLLIMAVLEFLYPRRKLLVSRAQRWFNNLGIVVLNTIIVRLLLPAGAVGVALLSQESATGLFNRLDLPVYIELIAAILLLDLAIYLQHVMFHALPLLWKLHRVHHADPDFDVTTGLRFHPFEILISMLIKFAAIFLIGPSAIAVIIFEILLNATSMFNHGNLRLPAALDSLLRLFIVTPDMHRVHHSIEQDETNSNFGFNLPWWDRLFRTYRAQPEKGHESMQIGVDKLSDPAQITRLYGMLALPFVQGGMNYSINRKK